MKIYFFSSMKIDFFFLILTKIKGKVNRVRTINKLKLQWAWHIFMPSVRVADSGQLKVNTQNAVKGEV